MAGTGITISHNMQEIAAGIRITKKRFGNLEPALKIIGATLKASVERNFERGGRPKGWKRLSAVTLAKKKGGSILVGKGHAGGLMGSIHVEVGRNSVMVGTNKKYAAIHQFGAKQGSFGVHRISVPAHTRTRKGKPYQVKAHTKNMALPWGDIPARPFLMVQDGDWENIDDGLSNFILQGKL